MHMKMKNIIYIIALILFSGCGNFLDEYSQDLVVPKTVSDLNEVLLGNGYLPSAEVEYLRSGSIGWQLHLLDDDINTVIAYNATKGRTEMNQIYYGYTTWQLEVGRNYEGTGLSGDNGNWDALYQRINSMNIILHELGNVSQSTEQEKADAIRVQGECYFLRAQFYLMLVNLYAKPYATDNTTELGVPLKLTYYVEHDKDKETQFDRTPVAEVYAQIVKDLNESVKCFTVSPQTKSFYRASKDAALLLLSRVYLYMQDWKNAENTAKEIEAMGVKAKGYASNAANFEDTAKVVEAIHADFGRIDILVNNAGITRDGLMMRMSEQQWDMVINVNLKSAFNFVHACTPIMMRQKAGSIINMASVVGVHGNAGQANYAASKAGMIALAKSIAQELGSRGIRANAIAPGFILTDMTAALSDEVRAEWAKKIPLRRGGTPEDVANIATFLASDMSSYVSGQVIQVDGGMNM